MIKTAFLISLSAMIINSAIAADIAPRPMPNGAPQDRPGGIMQNLTEEQRKCIENFGCEMPQIPDMHGNRPEGMGDITRPAPGVKPDKGERPEMTDEQKANMECMHKAMESCGVPVPQRPEHNPDFPDRNRPDKQ